MSIAFRTARPKAQSDFFRSRLVILIVVDADRMAIAREDKKARVGYKNAMTRYNSRETPGTPKLQRTVAAAAAAVDEEELIENGITGQCRRATASRRQSRCKLIAGTPIKERNFIENTAGKRESLVQKR